MKLVAIRNAAIVACLVVVSGCAAPAHPKPPPPAPVAELWPTAGWPVAPPESQGIDSNVLAYAIEAIRASRLPVHSLFVERNGHAVVDAHFFPFHDDETHDLASVTKSVVSTLVGIAERDHRLGDLNEPIAALLPAENLARDPGKSRITLAELLSMTSGLDCRVAPGVNLLRQMEETSDWIAFTWNLPQTWVPGTTFGYCGGGMHIVSAALTVATGESAFALARGELFAPLGIARVVWPADYYGNSRGFADLELDPRDAAKLGYLWLHHGRWANEQIVSPEYLTAALSPQATVQTGIQYGYGFWLYPSHVPYDFEANGRGGQRITVIPSQNVVEVVTGGGADANVLTPLIAAAIRANAPLRANPAGDARLAAAVARAAQPPDPVTVFAIPAWALAIASQRFVISDNPLGLRTIRLSFPRQDLANVEIGLASGATEVFTAGLDGVPQLTLDATSGHRVAMTGSWRPGAFDLDYNTVARIDDYRLHLAPVPTGLTIHLTERTGLVDAVLNAVPG